MAPPRKSRKQPSRSRAQQRRASTTTRVVIIAVVIVLVGALVLSIVIAGGGGGGSNSSSSKLPSGFNAEVQFNIRCAACHGAGGQGGTAPKLAGGAVVARYPNIEDQIAVVTNGRGQMPAFKTRGLNPAEIRAIVEYTRTQL